MSIPLIVKLSIIVYYYLTVSPGQPHTLSVDGVDATSIIIGWVAPTEVHSPITFYSINTHNLNGTGRMTDIVLVNTTTNSTFFNVTNLLPGTTYELSVVAVSQGGDVIARSDPSDPATGSTEVTG